MTRRSRDAPALLTPAEQFEQLYLDCETKLFRYLARRVGPSLAEDLTAEAFAIAWQRFPDYDPTRAASLGSSSGSGAGATGLPHTPQNRAPTSRWLPHAAQVISLFGGGPFSVYSMGTTIPVLRPTSDV